MREGDSLSSQPSKYILLTSQKNNSEPKNLDVKGQKESLWHHSRNQRTPFSCIEKAPSPAAGGVSLLIPLPVAFEEQSDLEDAQQREEEWCGDVGVVGEILGSSTIENPPANAGDADLIPGSEDPWRKKQQPTPVFLLEKSHGQRSLAGHSFRGLQKS